MPSLATPDGGGGWPSFHRLFSKELPPGPGVPMLQTWTFIRKLSASPGSPERAGIHLGPLGWEPPIYIVESHRPLIAFPRVGWRRGGCIGGEYAPKKTGVTRAAESSFGASGQNLARRSPSPWGDGNSWGAGPFFSSGGWAGGSQLDRRGAGHLTILILPVDRPIAAQEACGAGPLLHPGGRLRPGWQPGLAGGLRPTQVLPWPFLGITLNRHHPGPCSPGRG